MPLAGGEALFAFLPHSSPLIQSAANRNRLERDNKIANAVSPARTETTAPVKENISAKKSWACYG
jgi:hypothetical protein